MKMISRMVCGILVAAGLLAAGPATADTYTFTGSSGNLSASASFVTSGVNNQTLTITLVNTSTSDVLQPTDVLTAVFFDTRPDMVLTPQSATLPSASTVLFQPSSTAANLPNLSGEWAYAHDIANAPGGTENQGVSSTGLGLFGGGNFGPNPVNLQGPVSVDGLQYGITSAGDNANTGNTPVTGQYALIKNSVVFTLTMSGSLLDIYNVRFLYGTSTSGPLLYGTPNSPSVPDGGSTLVLLGSALVGVGLLRRKLAFK